MTSVVLVALRVRATPARAFDVFTRDIAAWWRPSPMFRFTPRDPGVLSFQGGQGGAFVETLANGKVFEIGRIEVWSPPERLVFGWRQATFSPGQQTRVEVVFEAVGEETRVTVRHAGWDSVPASHVARHGFSDAIFARRHAQWWRDLLLSFDGWVARGGGAPA